MSQTPSKIRVGLMTQDRAWDAQFKEALAQLGGGYVQSAKSMLEVYQGAQAQKVQVIAYVAPEGETGAEAQNMIQFFRSKREFQTTPILIMVQGSSVQMKRLLLDSRVRGFSTAGGVFLALMTLQPMILNSASQDFVEPITTDWIQHEFLESLTSKLGQGSQFQVTPASDDDLRASFLSQALGEVRSHLGWFKFSARLLEGDSDGLTKMLKTSSREQLEQMADLLLKAVIDDFRSKVELDLQARGAIFFPPIEELPQPERKILYGRNKSKGLVFQSSECRLSLEIIQSI